MANNPVRLVCQSVNIANIRLRTFQDAFVKGRTGVGSGDEANANANALNRQVRRISTTIGCWQIQFGSFSINGILWIKNK